MRPGAIVEFFVRANVEYARLGDGTVHKAAALPLLAGHSVFTVAAARARLSAAAVKIAPRRASSSSRSAGSALSRRIATLEATVAAERSRLDSAVASSPAARRVAAIEAELMAQRGKPS